MKPVKEEPNDECTSLTTICKEMDGFMCHVTISDPSVLQPRQTSISQMFPAQTSLNCSQMQAVEDLSSRSLHYSQVKPGMKNRFTVIKGIDPTSLSGVMRIVLRGNRLIRLQQPSKCSVQTKHSVPVLHAMFTAPLTDLNCVGSTGGTDELTDHRAVLSLNNSTVVCEKKFRCQQCGNSFTAFSALQRHQKLHTGEKPFLCPFTPCIMKFNVKRSLQIHIMRIHTRERPHACKECGKAFVRSNDLKEHQRAHERKFICQECGSSFPEPKSLQQHQRHHPRVILPQSPVTHCGVKFDKESSLESHMWLHTDGPILACSVTGCERKFPLRRNLINHLMTHVQPGSVTSSGDLDEKIQKSASSSDSRQDTVISLSASTAVCKKRNRGTHACQECGRCFTDPRNLKRHTKNLHRSENPYPCPITSCTMKFCTKNQLEKHKRSHRGERPFACSEAGCGVKFAYRYSLTRHLRRHSQQRPE